MAVCPEYQGKDIMSYDHVNNIVTLYTFKRSFIIFVLSHDIQPPLESEPRSLQIEIESNVQTWLQVGRKSCYIENHGNSNEKLLNK